MALTGTPLRSYYSCIQEEDGLTSQRPKRSLAPHFCLVAPALVIIAFIHQAVYAPRSNALYVPTLHSSVVPTLAQRYTGFVPLAAQNSKKPSKITGPDEAYDVNVDEKKILLAQFQRRMREEKFAKEFQKENVQADDPNPPPAPVLKRPTRSGGVVEVTLSSGPKVTRPKGSSDSLPSEEKPPKGALLEGLKRPVWARAKEESGEGVEAVEDADSTPAGTGVFAELKRPVPKPKKEDKWTKPKPKEESNPAPQTQATTGGDPPALLQRPKLQKPKPPVTPAEAAAEAVLSGRYVPEETSQGEVQTTVAAADEATAAVEEEAPAPPLMARPQKPKDDTIAAQVEADSEPLPQEPGDDVHDDSAPIPDQPAEGPKLQPKAALRTPPVRKNLDE